MFQKVRAGAGRTRISAQHQLERRRSAEKLCEKRGRWTHVRLFRKRTRCQGRRVKHARQRRLGGRARKPAAPHVRGAGTHARRRQRPRHWARHRRRDGHGCLRANARSRQRRGRDLARWRASGQTRKELVGDARDFSRHRREIQGGGPGRAHCSRFARERSSTRITCTHGSCRYRRFPARRLRRERARRRSNTGRPSKRPHRDR